MLKMKNYIQLFVLSLGLLLLVIFTTCQKQSVEKKAKHEVIHDSLTTDTTKIKTNESLYTPEPDGYKGIHQQEKEQHDQKK